METVFKIILYDVVQSKAIETTWGGGLRGVGKVFQCSSEKKKD
jgi:hypothetical protein